ncbi:MAG: S46 family peptidase [Bacteroidales bacterium]|nr:S46 family peptidase [Bacteroidales bacterium]
MKKVIITLLVAILTLPTLIADEGMWIPMLLKRNEADMQQKGMKISADDIYSINQACLKDAIVLFGGGCTGEFVSDKGLLFTNHHCGYSYIARNSTLEHNYLANGFWAKSLEEEIPCPGLSVTRLVRMDDVTTQVLEGITDNMSESERALAIATNIKAITQKATEGTHYKAIIKPFYYGNQYFMYVNEVFTDVRMVGTPPSNIGKFGGDTDNWMWPRHTGDFSVFRVYAGKDNKPADYSADNKPYKPLQHLTISLKGVEENDFTFVFGYPGTTNRYATSQAVDLAANVTNPIRIDLRTIRLNHYNNAMNQDAAQRLKYSSRVASIANGWKKWQGESQGINRLNGVEKKQDFEKRFQQWAADKPMYKDVLPNMEKNYAKLKDIELKTTYFGEAVMAADFMNRAAQLYNLAKMDDDSMIAKRVEALIKNNENYFKDFDKHTIVDRAIFIETFTYMCKAGIAGFVANKDVDASKIEEMLGKVYDKSILSSEKDITKLLKNYKAKDSKKILKDPAVALYRSAVDNLYSTADRQQYKELKNEINRLYRLYVKGMMEMDANNVSFPDANLTLRVAYGHVKGFRPKDGVYYKPYTTLEGIMEKENPDIYDYVVEPRLKELYNTRNYGQYANSKGELPVGFIATNHTTGGNSGSPVLNANGELIGLNFDRCWEGTMSDLLFDPDYCRNITLDIRYCLFIIDKYAGAKNLIDELTIKK